MWAQETQMKATRQASRTLGDVGGAMAAVLSAETKYKVTTPSHPLKNVSNILLETVAFTGYILSRICIRSFFFVTRSSILWVSIFFIRGLGYKRVKRGSSFR